MEMGQPEFEMGNRVLSTQIKPFVHLEKTLYNSGGNDNENLELNVRGRIRISQWLPPW